MTIKFDSLLGSARTAFSGSSVSPVIDPTKQLVAYYGFRSGAKDLWGGYNGTTNGGLTKITLPDGSKKGYDFNSVGWIDLPANKFFYKANDFTVVQNLKVGTNGKSYSSGYGTIIWGSGYVQILTSKVMTVSHSKSLGDFVQVALVKSSVTGTKFYMDGVLVLDDPTDTADCTQDGSRLTCIGKTGSLPYDYYNGGIYDHWNYVGELSNDVIGYLSEHYGFATDFIPYVGRTGKLFDVGMESDANLVAYWPLHDGNLVDTVSGRVLTNHGCSHVPGKGMFPGTLADLANPDYRNLTNYLHCSESLGINGSGNLMVMAQVQLFHTSPASIDQPMIVSERSNNVANGLVASKDGPYVTAFRLAENIEWQWGKTRTVSYSTAESGIWAHFIMRKVWGEWMETMVNVTNPGGGDRYWTNPSGTASDFQSGFSVFGEFHGGVSQLYRQSTAIVKEIAVFNSYDAADPNGWNKLVQAYGNPT